MRRHLLVTNDFPPKVGGIQNYLWELWRRLPPEAVTVLTTPYRGAAAWDAEQDFRVVRARDRVLLPRPGMAAMIDDLADEVDADLVVVDPALPLGFVAPRLRHRYGVVLHGAEVTVPGRLPVARRALSRVLVGAEVVIAAGGYPAAEAERAAGRPLPVVEVPPGVDVERFRPLSDERRRSTRERFGLDPDGELVVSVSRLVPRKGFDSVIRAVGVLAATRPGLRLAIGGGGRDRRRLERIADQVEAPVTFLGRFDENDKADIYGMGDVFAMACRTRWLGLEQEGFGIVFLEAAAAGVPQVAGRSGGAEEAVQDGVTGLVVSDPTDPGQVALAIGRILSEDDLRAAMAVAGRRRAVEAFSYDVLAARLAEALG